jgi:hypothetical protein
MECLNTVRRRSMECHHNTAHPSRRSPAIRKLRMVRRSRRWGCRSNRLFPVSLRDQPVRRQQCHHRFLLQECRRQRSRDRQELHRRSKFRRGPRRPAHRKLRAKLPATGRSCPRSKVRSPRRRRSHPCNRSARHHRGLPIQIYLSWTSFRRFSNLSVFESLKGCA